MTTRDDLVVRIGGDASGVDKATKQAARALGGFSADVKKSFSGLGGQIFNLRGALAGLAGGFSLKAIIDSTVEAERRAALLETKLRSTGRAAEFSTQHLLDMAGALQKVSTFGDEELAGALTKLLNFNRVSGKTFDDAAQAAVDFAAATGTSVEAAAETVGRALQQPDKAARQLRAANILLTKSEQEKLDAMVNSGRVADAQALILGKLETAYGGAAAAAADTFGGALTQLKNAAGDLLEGSGGNLNDAKDAVQDLTKVLQSDETKQGFSVITGAVITLVGWLAKGIAKFSEFGKAIGEGAARLFTGAQGNIDDQVQRLRTQLESYRKAAGPTPSASMRSEIARVERELGFAYKRQFEMTGGFGGAGKPASSRPDVAPPRGGAGSDEADETDDEDRKSAAAAARAAAAAARREKAAADAAQKVREAELRERIEQEERYLKVRADVEQRLLEATGRTAEARKAELEREFAGIIETLRAQGDDAGVAIAIKLQGVELARAEFERLETELDERQQAYQRRLQEIDTAVQTGARTRSQARRDQVAAAQDLVAEEERIADALAAQADVIGDPALLDKVRALRQEILITGTVVDETFNQVRGAFEDGFGGMFESLQRDITDVKGAVEDMLSSIVASIQRIIAQRLAEQLADSLFGGLKGGGGGGDLLDALIGGAMSVFGGGMSSSGVKTSANIGHAGALIGAPGPRKSVPAITFADAPRLHGGGMLGQDEVPFIGLKGERVLSREQTRAYDRGAMTPVVNVNIATPDARSFRVNRGAVESSLGSALERAMRRNR